MWWSLIKQMVRILPNGAKNHWKRHQKFKVTIVVADNAWNIGAFYNQTSMGDETEGVWWCSFSQL